MVRTNEMLRDMNITVSARDERKVEVLASDLPLNHGAQLAVDVTFRSALKACGAPATNAARVDGAGFTQARRDKELKCHELVECARCLLVVVAIETGGRWSQEAVTFLDSLASACSCEALPLMQRSSFLAWRKRWTRMLAVSCCRTFATSLTSFSEALDGVDGPTPDLADLFGWHV